jgi:hypothetical protein
VTVQFACGTAEQAAEKRSYFPAIFFLARL